MKIKIGAMRKGEPWAPVIATLTTLERAITTGESDAMEARWKFGRELLSHRKEYKGRQVVPLELMKLAIERCGLSNWEVRTRIRFAEKFATQKLMRDAVSHYPSWRQMIAVGLVDKSKSVSDSAVNAGSRSRISTACAVDARTSQRPRSLGGEDPRAAGASGSQ
jgi:hypothetical protein